MVIRHNLSKSARVVNYEGKGRLNAPSAVRNTDVIVNLVRETHSLIKSPIKQIMRL